MSLSNCLFCQIIKNKVAAKIIYADEHIHAFHDIAPQAPVHVLIIPNKHIATLNDFTDEENILLGHMLLCARNIARQLNVADDGYRLNINCNRHGGQTVYHTHLHLLAGRSFSWPPG
jgi:histidine triad (HIT) family protein